MDGKDSSSYRYFLLTLQSHTTHHLPIASILVFTFYN